jgi:biopolymer transport protein ExbD/biopolymer transport protein TolR
MPVISPKRGGGLYDPVAEINVTPLVDVMLVLLIVFMITAPMLAAGMRVDLPRANSAQPLDPVEPVIITVMKDGKLFVGQDEIARADLAEAIRARLGGEPNRTIHVRGDRDLMYGEMVALMDQLAQNGFMRIALVANVRPDPSASETQPAVNLR